MQLLLKLNEHNECYVKKISKAALEIISKFKIIKKLFDEYRFNSRISKDLFYKLGIPNDKNINKELNPNLRCV